MKIYDNVLLELKKLGLMPQEYEGNILFKYQMMSYLFMPDEEDEDYYALYLPYIYEVTDENEEVAMKVVNDCNNSLKSLKFVSNDSHIWIGYELMLPPNAELSYIVERTIKGLFGAKLKFDMEMKGL